MNENTLKTPTGVNAIPADIKSLVSDLERIHEKHIGARKPLTPSFENDSAEVVIKGK